MSRESWNTLNDLSNLLTAKVIALPLLGLLCIKLYSIAPEALGYALGLTLLASLGCTRWGLGYLAAHPEAFASQYRITKARERP